MTYLSKTYKYCKIGTALVSGAAAATNIAITGIKTTDELIMCIEVETSTAAHTDRLSEASITSDGNIQLSTTSTASDQLLVMWVSADD